MAKSKLLIAAALSSLSAAELLRGTPDANFSSKRASLIESTPAAVQPEKKDLHKLKRLNIERKHLNARKKQQLADDKKKDKSADTKRKDKSDSNGSKEKADDKQTVVDEKREWMSLSKEEKKALLEELKSEEELGRNDMSKKEWKEMLERPRPQGKDEVDKDESDKDSSLISQYSTLLNLDINSNEIDSIWKSLSKEEKKQLLAIQEGKLIIDGNKVVENPDYSVDKLSKEEKKEQAKLDKGDTPKPNAETASRPKPKPNDQDEGKDDTMNPNSSAANTFVNPEKGEPDIESQPDPETSTSSTTTTSSKPATIERPEDDMEPNSEQANKPNNEANDFVIPMPSLTFSTTTTTTSTSTSTKYGTVGSSNACNGCFEFETELQDPSTPLDEADLKWTMNGLPWSTFTKDCYNSKSCVASGITDALSLGEPTYSNLTLTTDKEFEGGILTFYLKDTGLQMPNEAFFVSVEDKKSQSVVSESNGWIEYSVVVGRGQRVVTWTHVYNPLGLEALPDRQVGQLIVDDLRYSPFHKVGRWIDQDFEGNNGKGMMMTSDGDARWEVDSKASNSGSYSIVAKTRNIKVDSGSSNVNFVLYSQYGGTLKYKLTTSTTPPYDDFAVLINDKPVEAVFGVTRTAPAFEYRELEVPSGKVVVTFQHRKNPGSLIRSLLDSLGGVETTGQTRLDDIKFVPYNA